MGTPSLANLDPSALTRAQRVAENERLAGPPPGGLEDLPVVLRELVGNQIVTREKGDGVKICLALRDW